MLNLGLLCDIDGPIASPITRSIAIPSIAQDLVRLAGAGVPVAFITGRSDAFVREQVLPPLLSAGLEEALTRSPGRMFAVFEKGAVWATIEPRGLGEITVDRSVALPPAVGEKLRTLVDERFSDTMFFDDTKRAMISVEQRTDVQPADYRAAQTRFDDLAFDVLAGHGLGIRHGSRVQADAQGAVPFRIDPTIISTDIESVLLDKDRAAERTLAYFARSGELPTRWRSIGDSRSDYRMADHLHASGYDVAHVDVRPSDGVLEKPYPVIVIDGKIHDEAGAEFLAHWVREFSL